LEKATVNPDPVPESVTVPLASLADLGVEHWRLTAWLAAIPGAAAGSAAAPARHALRRIGDVLARCEVEVRSLDGLPFDAGLAARVIDAADDPTLPAGQTVVGETLAPMVLWRGTVVRAADVVTRRGTGQ
jgi:hypothetical protein